MLNLHVNGEVIQVPASVKTVPDLIEHLKLKSPAMVVEHNEVILQKEAHKDTVLTAGDKVEIVQFVGGG
jgi:sulfur carrier protein